MKISLLVLALSFAIFARSASAETTIAIPEIYNGVKWVVEHVLITGQILPDPECPAPVTHKDLTVQMEITEGSNKKDGSASIELTGRTFTARRKLATGKYKVKLFDQRKNMILDEKLIVISSNKLHLTLTSACKE